ncbi:hypothetical protein Avbf_19189 [Armadillidium vulgare]|nr:hypothetical protein Avbf_19189 [Armadillidium vulgare]
MQMLLHVALFVVIVVFKKHYKGVAICLLLNDDYVEDYDEAWVQQFIRFFSNCFRNLLPSSWTIEREPPMDDGNQNFRWERDREYEE